MKKSNRAWIVAAVAVAAWVVGGVFWRASPHLDWLAKGGLLINCVIPALFVVGYTALGLVSPNKWWRNDIATNLVWLMIADVIDHAMITWAVFFHHGDLSNNWAAWAYIGCQYAAGAIVIWRAAIFTRAELYRRRGASPAQ